MVLYSLKKLELKISMCNLKKREVWHLRSLVNYLPYFRKIF